MLKISGKATVPVLQLEDRVIDESLEIMTWALHRSDPDGWLTAAPCHHLVQSNDGYFKHYLDRYKYCDRYPQHSQDYYFNQAGSFLEELEEALVADPGTGKVFLETPEISLIDIAIFPFVRQFAAVDRNLFASLPLPKLVYWLDSFLVSPLFSAVMHKYPVWDGQEAEPMIFGVH